jgi:hypothetical protein
MRRAWRPVRSVGVAVLLCLLGGPALDGGLAPAAAGTSPFITVPLATGFIPPSGYKYANVATGGGSMALVPRRPGNGPGIRNADSRNQAAPRVPIWKHEVAAHLAVIGVSDRDDGRLHQPRDDAHQGVTVLRP